MNKFSKANFSRISNDVLKFQLKNLYPIEVKNDPERTNILFLHHDRNFSTFLTIQYLFKHGRIADIYSLSRAMFESIISMGLLSKKIIREDLSRYKNYQFTEIFKTHSHLKRLGLEATNGLSRDDVDYVKKKREEYIEQFGRNLSTWTGKSLEENVKSVDQHYPPSCNENRFYEYLYCQVYRKGSQSVHGSFAGLSKFVKAETLRGPDNLLTQRFKPNDPHLIFSCFHSIIVFASSIRFMGVILKNKEVEIYFHKITRSIISEA